MSRNKTCDGPRIYKYSHRRARGGKRWGGGGGWGWSCVCVRGGGGGGGVREEN